MGKKIRRKNTIHVEENHGSKCIKSLVKWLCVFVERWFLTNAQSYRAAYSPICEPQSDSNRCSTIQNNTHRKGPSIDESCLPNSRSSSSLRYVQYAIAPVEGCSHINIRLSFAQPIPAFMLRPRSFEFIVGLCIRIFLSHIIQLNVSAVCFSLPSTHTHGSVSKFTQFTLPNVSQLPLCMCATCTYRITDTHTFYVIFGVYYCCGTAESVTESNYCDKLCCQMLI